MRGTVFPRILVALALSTVAACGPTWPPDQPPVDLPVLGVVGDPPPPEVEWTDADEAQIRLVPTGVVTLSSSGDLWFDGVALGQDPEALTALLIKPEPSAATPSPRHVIVRADRHALWSRVSEIQVACAAPSAAVGRIHFAAQPEAGGAEGTVALFLPYDHRPLGFDSLDFDPVVFVRLRDGDDGLDAAHLYHAVLPIARDARCGVEIYAEAGSTVGEVLALADAALRAGAARVDFMRAGPITDPSSRVHGRLVLRADYGTPALGSGTAAMPPRARATGIVGVTDCRPLLTMPELEYEDPPDVDDPGVRDD